MNGSFSDIEALLLLSRTPGIRMRGLQPFFEPTGTGTEGTCLLKEPGEILEWIESGANPSWKASLKATRKIFDPARELEKAEGLGIELLPFGDPKYPFLLKETSDPPLVLYVRGNLLESDQAAVALVGSRHPGLYGLEQAKRFGEKLAAWGLTIVSGFARGIDRQVHEAALSVRYGRTIAVLGSGLDIVYPREHQALYEEMAERGALISEFALGTPPLAENFPKRNRIIAGLSLGVLVIEAHSRSGSLITAHLAAEEGREVFALPGRVDQLGSRGTHLLLKEGAQLVESPEEIFDTLSSQLWPLVSLPSPDGSFDEEEKDFLRLFAASPLAVEEVARQADHPVSLTVGLLTRLELKRALRKRPDGRYERVGNPREKV